ncbi:uncharacterized protein LOC109401259 isoform X1 [Aedes albopictus]|uniref:Retrotransposon gag domain-containing protein n=1 Tax=Aedes albopictus TaxID=7160 RepID=A0ABM1ZHB2_AEDAL
MYASQRMRYNVGAQPGFFPSHEFRCAPMRYRTNNYSACGFQRYPTNNYRSNNNRRWHNNYHKPYMPVIRAPRFDGTIIGYPAPQFLKDFETYISSLRRSYFVPRSSLIDIFRSCLEKDGAIWMSTFGGKYRSFEELTNAFLRRFWSTTVQRHIQDQFQYGTYKQRAQRSKMSNYFLAILRRMIHVTHPPTDSHFIETIGYHFPFHIQQKINKMRSTEEVYLYLLEEDRMRNYCMQLYLQRCERLAENSEYRANEDNQEESSTNNSESSVEPTAGENITDQNSVDSSGMSTTIDGTTAKRVYLRSCSGGRCNEHSAEIAREIHEGNSSQEHEIRETGHRRSLDKNGSIKLNVRLKCINSSIVK